MSNIRKYKDNESLFELLHEQIDSDNYFELAHVVKIVVISGSILIGLVLIKDVMITLGAVILLLSPLIIVLVKMLK